MNSTMSGTSPQLTTAVRTFRAVPGTGALAAGQHAASIRAPFVADGVEPALRLGLRLDLLLVLPTAGLYVRLFIIQHDCGHGSYFASSGPIDRSAPVSG